VIRTGRTRGAWLSVAVLLLGAGLFLVVGELTGLQGAFILCGGLFTLAAVEWQGKL
jgi:hypothetical protein